LGEQQSQRTRWVVLVLINLASLGCLVWALRDASFGDFKDDVVTLNYAWVALAVAIELSVYLSQAVRWRLVLRPVVSLSFGQAVRAIYVGLVPSEVLPFRGGEAVRGFLVSRWTQLPFSVSMASVLIEREFDGIWLWLGLWLSLKYVELPKQLGYVNDTLGLFVLGGAVILALALFRPRPPRSALRRPGWRHHLAVLMDDLALIGHSRYLYFALLQSVPYLLLQVFPIWAGFQAYGFDLGLGAAVALMLILRLSSIVPQAPVNLGLFQILTKEFLVRGQAHAVARRFHRLGDHRRQARRTEKRRRSGRSVWRNGGSGELPINFPGSGQRGLPGKQQSALAPAPGQVVA
jgi:hypothetical protein